MAATSLPALAETVRRRVDHAGGRVIIALAGAPGSGKSTLADQLAARLNGDGHDVAAVLPMDGFHYDDLYLIPAGLRPRKGAPETFDVGGLTHVLQRLRARDEPAVAVPVFDRSIEIARAGARLIPAAMPVVIVEGNWLLLRDPPWNALRGLFDLTVMVTVPQPVLRERLLARWAGLGIDVAEMLRRVDDNDLPNGRRVVSGSVPADITIAGI